MKYVKGLFKASIYYLMFSLTALVILYLRAVVILNHKPSGPHEEAFSLGGEKIVYAVGNLTLISLFVFPISVILLLFLVLKEHYKPPLVLLISITLTYLFCSYLIFWDSKTMEIFTWLFG